MNTGEPIQRYCPQLDELLTPEQCAAWFGRKERWLLENTDKIVPFRPTPKVTVYHPRTILAKMAFDAGVPLEIVAAIYGVNQPAKTV